MAAILTTAVETRDENPYAAPQTSEMILPLAMERAELRTTPTDEFLPHSTVRWMQAARAVYLTSFVVPIIATGFFMPFAGSFLFFMGAILCWHPWGIPWWANVLLVLSQRNLHRGRSRRGMLYAGLAVVAALSWFVIDALIFSGKAIVNPPYLCWLAAMIVQWIAAVDMRQYNQNRCGEVLSRELE